MEILISISIFILGFILVCHTPFLPIIRLYQHGFPSKVKIIRCFIGAWFKSLITLPFDLLAPVVVPLALIFTKWEDEKLPWLFRFWDNDAGPHGDVRTDDPNDGLGGWGLKPVPLEDTPEARAMCYWAPRHHPRSFYARFVWLGLRNRASYLSQLLGVKAEGDYKVWVKDKAKLYEVNGYYKYIEEITVGSFVIRLHYGYKVPTIPGEPKAAVTAVGFSFKRKVRIS